MGEVGKDVRCSLATCNTKEAMQAEVDGTIDKAQAFFGIAVKPATLVQWKLFLARAQEQKPEGSRVWQICNRHFVPGDFKKSSKDLKLKIDSFPTKRFDPSTRQFVLVPKQLPASVVSSTKGNRCTARTGLAGRGGNRGGGHGSAGGPPVGNPPLPINPFPRVPLPHPLGGDESSSSNSSSSSSSKNTLPSFDESSSGSPEGRDDDFASSDEDGAI